MINYSTYNDWWEFLLIFSDLMELNRRVLWFDKEICSFDHDKINNDLIDARGDNDYGEIQNKKSISIKFEIH